MEKIQAYFRPYEEAPDARRIDVLDGIRVLCVLLVGWFHIWQQGWLSPSFKLFGQHYSLDFLLRSGYIWVDGLLLLSGFLLYLPYTQEGSAMPAPWPFYKRRLIRILPSYLLCILPMFVLAVGRGAYATTMDAVKDLFAHLTFTHTLFQFSYYSTPLNGALWTLGVEMQFYFLFPFLARAFRKHPFITWCLMTGAAFGFRAFAATHEDSSMYFNQLPAFLDVYANGFLAAAIFAALKRRLGTAKGDPKIKLLFTALFVLCICHLLAIAQGQAGTQGYENIRLGQMDRRFPQSAALACAMVCAAFSLPALRFVLGNPVMRVLSEIFFQFYIYHQLLAVQLKDWGFPASESATPWMGDYAWQVRYMLCCFLGALILAALITYLFERPLARWLRRASGAQ